MVEKELSLFYLVALFLLSYGGYGPTKLLLPDRLRGFRFLLMPLVGYSFLAVFSSYATLHMNMTWGTWAFLALATVINGYVFFRGGPEVPLTRNLVAVWGLALLSYVLGVLPLIHAGSTAFVGLQWDLEIYLPFTEYLKSYPIGSALVGPPENPLVGYLNSPAFRGGSGWGFSYMEAALGTILRWESYQTFRPSLQFVLSLSVPSVYVFCRAVLGMSQGASWLASALWALNGLSLWVASIGLAGHAVSFFALPLAITATYWALEAPSFRTVVLAGLVLAGLLLSYYTGALPVYVLSVAALGGLMLVIGPKRGRVVTAGLGIVAAVGVLALAGHLRFLEVVPAFRAFGFSQGWHVPAFSPFSEPLGLSTYPLVAQRVSPEDFLGPLGEGGGSLVAGGLTWAAFLLIVLASFRPFIGAFSGDRSPSPEGWKRGIFLAITVTFGAFLFYLRVISPYFYGYFKVLSLGSFLLVAGLAQGMAALWVGGWFKGWDIARRGLLVGFGALFVPMLLFNTFLSIRYFWDPDPQELPKEVWELQDLRRILPKGAEVYVSQRSAYDSRMAGMVAYFLRDNPLVGSIKTTYGELNRLKPEKPYSYLLLRQEEDPQERGLTEQELLWRNDLVSLYRAPERWLMALELADVNYAFSLPKAHDLMKIAGEGWEVRTNRKVWEGKFPLLNGGSGLGPGVTQLQAEFSLLLFSPETLVIELGDQSYQVTLPPGLVSYRTPPFSVPNYLRIERERLDPPLWLLGVRISLPGEETQVYTAQNLFAISPSLSFDGEETRLSLDYLTAELRGGHLTLALELYSSSTEAKPARAWELAQIKGRTNGRKEVVVDLSAGECEAVPEGADPGLALSLPAGLVQRDENGQALILPEGRTKGLQGEYEAQLAVYYVGEEIARWPWFAVGTLQGSASGGNPGVTVKQGRSFLGFSFFTAYLPIPNEARQAVGLIPLGEGVYLSPRADPDRSFIPVAAYLLAQRGDNHPAEERPPVYALLWQGEDPQRVGFREDEKIWEGQEAVLYLRKGEAAETTSKETAALLPDQFYARTWGRLDGANALLQIDYLGPRPAEAYLGIDVYKKGPCRPAHYGWWAMPLASAGPGMEFSLDLAGQKGRMTLQSGEAVPLGYETWPTGDGDYRAFLQLKYGDEYLSLPAFEFSIVGGKVVAFESFDVDQVASLMGLR